MAIIYAEKGHWLHTAISAAGHRLEQINGVWVSDDDVAVQAIIDGFDPMPQAVADKLAAIRVDAASRIIAKWPAWAQQNCALGVYPPAIVEQCAADIAAVISASNAAEDAALAATTLAELEAVTATWPTL